MQDEEPATKYGNNFETHPILSKLSTFDRIALSAELASEVNYAYAVGFNKALAQLGNMISELSKTGEGKFSDQAQTVLYLVWQMIDKVNEHFLDLYKNQDKALDPEENN